MAVTLAASRRRPGPGLASGFPASRRREITVAYLLLAPAVLMVFGVLAYPLGWSLWLRLAAGGNRRSSAQRDKIAAAEVFHSAKL